MSEAGQSRLATHVHVRDLPVLAYVGINPDEIGRRQPLIVSVDLETANKIVETIDDTIDYRKVAKLVDDLALTHIPLIETFGRLLTERCLAYPNVARVVVKIDKPFALERGIAGITVSANKVD